jgi:hypothetical protein
MDIYKLFELDEKELRRIIADFIADGQEENLYLDFKTVNSADFTNRDDKKNFAKALSGFANSSGGLIIWGVKAANNSKGIDCACGSSEITPISLFLNKLNRFTGIFVTPIVDGVKHKKIETKQDSGFAITLVPESDAGPHMAKGGKDRYYKRSGDSFYKMEHFDIEDMFGRRKKPKLSLNTSIVREGTISGSQGVSYDYAIIVGIENSGRGIAKYPYLSLKVNKPYKISGFGLNGNGRTGLPQLVKTPRDRKLRFGGNADIVIHPSSILDITRIEVRVHEENMNLVDAHIESEISAEDFRILKETIIVKGTEIIDQIKNV